jgi:hypothetical protein
MSDEQNKGWVEVNYDIEGQTALADLIYMEECECRYVEVLDSRTMINPDSVGFRTLNPSAHYEYLDKRDKGVTPFRKLYLEKNKDQKIILKSLILGPRCKMNNRDIRSLVSELNVCREIRIHNSNVEY